MIANLNKMDFTTMMISEEYYYKKFGLKTISLKKEIEILIRKMNLGLFLLILTLRRSIMSYLI